MDSRFSSRVLFGLFVLAGLLTVRSSAPTFVFDSYSATVTFNTYVETSLNTSTIAFGSLDPTVGNTSASNALRFTNTANSNTAIDLFINASTFRSGSNSFAANYLSIAKTFAGTYTSFYSNTTYLNGNATNLGYVENLAVSGTQDLYFKLYGPTGQAAGAYSSSLLIKSLPDGTAP